RSAELSARDARHRRVRGRTGPLATRVGASEAGQRTSFKCGYVYVLRSQVDRQFYLGLTRDLQNCYGATGERVLNSWDTAKVEITLGNAQPAAKRQSASRSRRTRRRLRPSSDER